MAADYFTPGAREIARHAKRLYVRARLWFRARELAKAETELGLLGWQQVDFDEETQRQVDELQNVEREQTRLINAAAEHSAAVRRLKGEYEAAQKAYQESRRQLAAEEKRAREPKQELERHLAEKRKIEPNFGKRIPELDRELRETTKLLSELLQMEPQTIKIKNEVVRLRERSVAIPNEKNDLRTQHLRTASAIRSLEEELDESERRLRDVESRAATLDQAWSAEERKFQEQMKEQEREKARVEKHIESLEGAKANPYQSIGKVLAENNLAPMNQPQALSKVKQLQFAIGALHQEALELRAAGEQENPALLRSSLLIWAALVFVFLVLLYAATR